MPFPLDWSGADEASGSNSKPKERTTRRKICKRAMRERKTKLEKYNSPRATEKRDHSRKKGVENQKSTGTAYREMRS
jgi:hypothetical protein